MNIIVQEDLPGESPAEGGFSQCPILTPQFFDSLEESEGYDDLACRWAWKGLIGDPVGKARFMWHLPSKAHRIAMTWGMVLLWLRPTLVAKES